MAKKIDRKLTNLLPEDTAVWVLGGWPGGGLQNAHRQEIVVFNFISGLLPGRLQDPQGLLPDYYSRELPLWSGNIHPPCLPQKKSAPAGSGLLPK